MESMDNKVSFIAGWTLTTVTSINLMGLFQAALVGLIGGFFGLFGKEAYYYVKGEVKRYLDDRSKTK
jgi:uncharacterized membrane protein YeaQ/YmgE (transglycosylase-associated protein family)